MNLLQVRRLNQKAFDTKGRSAKESAFVAASYDANGNSASLAGVVLYGMDR